MNFTGVCLNNNRQAYPDRVNIQLANSCQVQP